MKKIAICIPTFNRPQVILDIGSKIKEIVDDKIFDIYIYDSSPDSETEDIVQRMGADNFFYVRIPFSTHSSRKVYNICQEKKLQDEYEYLWILADYLFFSEKIIREILTRLNEKWDMLMLDFYDPEKRGSRQYFSPNEIFYEYAWSMTQYGIMILNCETVLKKADWKFLDKKYLVDKYKNFSHVLMYFETMLEIDGFRFYHMSIPKENVYYSIYKSKKSDYLDEYLHIWGYCWYQSIKALPDRYKNKIHVIKTACRYTKNLGEKVLVELKTRGVLTIGSFLKYIFIWHCISTVPVIVACEIVFLPYGIVRHIAVYGSVGAWIKHAVKHAFNLMCLKRFCKKYKQSYLYGAGVKAKKLANLMTDRSIPFEGFVVTYMKDNAAYINDHTVLEISQLKKENDIGIIIAVNEKNKKEVIPVLHKLGYDGLFEKDIV